VFRIHVEGPGGNFTMDATSKNALTPLGYAVRVVQTLPAGSLPAGDAKFWLEKDGVKLSDDIPIRISDHGPAINLDAVPLQYPKTLDMIGGAENKIAVTFQNRGKTTFDQYTTPMMLATAKPFDRTSALTASNWLYSDRPARILLDKPIPTGQTFVVNFQLKAPNVKWTTTYTESFALVSEGLQWMTDSIYTIKITVHPGEYTGETQVTPPSTIVQIFNTVRAAFAPKPVTVFAQQKKSPYITPAPNYTASILSNIGKTILKWLHIK